MLVLSSSFVLVLTTFPVLTVRNEIAVLDSVLDGEPMISCEWHTEQIMHGAHALTVLAHKCLCVMYRNQ